ncbi:hypothetical protein FCH28_05010 [Streptomyces piniterrae]|uniref:Uncharacterized protein n=1 Tax=Streptomyces piniterrae TaxID=2571125 RepID=A0A4U0NS80_9ACTN|nr:hypothetical protein [Streptomyces piniterrae]TJZ56872.1 hypothetical protein FCH28_05010 [Streptomyces piniterrae]
MTGHGDSYNPSRHTPDSRAEQLRAGFQQQGIPGIAEDTARQDRQKRLAYTVIAVFVTLLGLVLAIVRLSRGHQVGTWTGLYSAGIVLAGLGAVLARRASTRLTYAAVLVGAALLGVGDAVAGRL